MKEEKKKSGTDIEVSAKKELVLLHKIGHREPLKKIKQERTYD